MLQQRQARRGRPPTTSTMKEHPILFSAPMILAILAGTKTQTRRIINPQPEVSPQGNLAGEWLRRPLSGLLLPTPQDLELHSPFGQPGDRLWVRETLFWSNCDDGWCYQADNNPVMLEEYTAPILLKQKPAIPCIHMPREASRLLLDKVAGRVEQLLDISEADALAEGIMQSPLGFYRDYLNNNDNGCNTARESYFTLWDSLHGPGAHKKNKWLWVEEFKRIQP